MQSAIIYIYSCTLHHKEYYMKTYKYSLQTYHSKTGKHICPQCHKRTFVRYINNDTHQYLEDLYGRCDRESKCGYHKKPEQQLNETQRNTEPFNINNQSESAQPSYIDNETIIKHMGRYDKNSFILGLKDRFGDEKTKKAVNNYVLGTLETDHDKIIFWQLDSQLQCRGGKLLQYDRSSLKRGGNITWMHQVLGLQNFHLRQCLFGEHLITSKTDHVIVVESEKTAIIGSIVLDQYTWVATGGKTSSVYNKLQVLKDNRVILVPDIDAMKDWEQIASKLKGFTSVQVNNYLLTIATKEEIEAQYDIGDYLLNGFGGR